MFGAMARALPWATILDSEPISVGCGVRGCRKLLPAGAHYWRGQATKMGVGMTGTLWKEPQLWSRQA